MSLSCGRRWTRVLERRRRGEALERLLHYHLSLLAHCERRVAQQLPSRRIERNTKPLPTRFRQVA